MIDPKLQWANQIDVTNACMRKCSNCTRLLTHVKEPFYMSLDTFEEALYALRDFPTKSPKSPYVPAKHKVVGILGGEPMMHPKFEQLCKLMKEVIPNKANRGLWTGVKWQTTSHSRLIHRVFGYVNNNQHNTNCEHSPILVSISDVVEDVEEQKRLIDNCWLQRLWSATITPKGYFFCEVAGAMDMVFDGPGGLPVEPGCWDRPLSDFQEQIDRWCFRCGIPLNLKGRRDSEDVDDISPSNLKSLQGSPRVLEGRYILHESCDLVQEPQPWQYLK
jgi:hypothetical protein